MEKSEVMGVITEALKKDFDKRQQEPNQYVVAYYDKDENLLGYHADTFCNTTKDKLSAKRYGGDNPYSQLATIKKNLDYTLATTGENSKSRILGPISLRIKENDFKGLSGDEVSMYAEYLDEDVPKQRFKFKIM